MEDLLPLDTLPSLPPMLSLNGDIQPLSRTISK